ncbi:MAG: ferredoxin--NADP reductase [bacterium]
MLDDATVEELREKNYNASLADFHLAHEALAIVRVKPDFPIPDYKAGQYTTLGLGYWESRHSDAVKEEEPDEKRVRRLVRRAYSISCPVADGAGEIVPPENIDYVEFYIVMVIGKEGEPAPALTPRLFLKKTGDRLYMGTKFTGEYTLEGMEDIRGREDSLAVFAGTGTGEGPHNRMIWELLRTGHRGMIASINVARYKRDFAYEPIYRKLEAMHPNLSYHSLPTREPETINNKMYIQDYIESGKLEERLQREMRPEDTHIFLCGNPAMIGIPKIRDGGKNWPEGKKGVIQLMEERGFRMDIGRAKGNIHYEKYW